MKTLDSFCSKGFCASRLKVFFVVAILLIVTGFSTPVKAATYTVGTGGNYTTLTAAFTAINGGSITGAIILQITTGQTISTIASLNASGSGLANYTSVLIYPTAANLTITSSLASPMITFNGADNVTLDGRLNQSGTTKGLTFTNTSTTGSVIQYTADATLNTVKYCILKGVTTSGSNGVVAFTGGTTTGNNSNTIDNCDVTAGASTPTNAIYSAGTSVSIDNGNNVISNCNIYNYFNAGVASNGIYIFSNSSAWSILNNRFYQTASRNSTTSVVHHAINIVTASGIDYNVSNNTIGYIDAAGTSYSYYTSGTRINTRFYGIEMTVGTTSPSNVQGNTISGIDLTNTLNSGPSAAPGLFSGISILAGAVNIGTTSGNTIGGETGTSAIALTTSVTLHNVFGIYVNSAATVDIQNNHIGSIGMDGASGIGFNFYGINKVGTGGSTISANTIGSISQAGSITVGVSGTTTSGVCTFNGIANTATGASTITNNIIQNCSVYGTGASVFNGIVKTGGTSTIDISGNSLIAGINTGTGVITGISSTGAATTLNMNDNTIHSLSKTVTTGNFTAITNSGAVTSAININNNHLGISTNGLISFSAAYTGAVKCISNTAGAATTDLHIQGNDIRGIAQTSPASSAHTYITNTAATLSQDISSNTFTNLNVNTTGNVTFITVSNALSATGTQNVSSNSIVTAFNKAGTGGTVTFCNGTGASVSGSIITQNLNNFSNVTVPAGTTISGWVNSNASLNKTFSTNTFDNWTGSAMPLTVMSITTGSSTISDNVISNISTGTTAVAPIVAISTGATGAIAVTGNTISNLVTGNSANINSFTGITISAGVNVTITGNVLTGCTAGGTAASIFTGITVPSTCSGTLDINGNSIISGTNAGTGAFTPISNSQPFTTVNINDNIIRNCTVSTATGTFTAITNTGAATVAININNNHLGNVDGGLVTYSAATGTAVNIIYNTAGAATADLHIQGNDIRGIVHSIASTSVHTYITNSASTQSQDISGNTFTNLNVNTTGNVTFISISSVLTATGIQNVSSNSIVTAFNKAGTGGTVTFCNGTGASVSGSIITQNLNNFSNVTVPTGTTITGWINANASLNKTFSTNTFNNWTGSAMPLTVMSITTGSSTISDNVISNISTGTTAVAPIVAISTGATGAIAVTGNTISNLVTGNSANINSFTGITISAGVNVTITGNLLTGCTAGGTAASIFTGITVPSACTGTLDINGNSIISGTNAGSGAFTPIYNGCAFTTVNINDNLIRNCTVALAAGTFTAITNAGAATASININNNHLGNVDGGLVTYSAATGTAVNVINNTAGATTADLHIQGNDIRGIVHAIASTSVHTYITNSASTLSQDISGNTFTNLDVNTTGNVTFISISSALTATGTQNLSSNSIVTAFNKAGTGGTVTFCNGTGASVSGSIITQNLNNFSNVTVPAGTTITGWINANASLNKTFSTNTFNNWSGSAMPLTVMSITTGSSTISNNVISNISTGTTAVAPITVLSTGATGAITVTNNTISNVDTGTGAFLNSFTGITNNAGVNVNISGNTISGCSAGGTGASFFTGITVITAGSGTLDISGNSILSCNNSGTGAFTAISNGWVFTTANINDNIIRSNTIGTTSGTFTAITNTAAIVTTLNINNNHLGTVDGGLVSYSLANSGALKGITNTGGAATCALSIQGNDFMGITQTIAGTNAHTYILNSAATLSQNISSNTFTNMSVKTTGAIIFLSNSVVMPANGVQNVNGNSIVGTFVRTGNGTMTLFTSTAANGNSGVTINNNNNDFSNITVSGTASILGWVNTDTGAGAAVKTISGNTFSHWTGGTGTITAMNVSNTLANNAINNNSIHTISSGGSIYGITTAAGNDNIFLNDIHSLVSTGTTSTVNGIAITGGTLKEVYQNTIYDLQANNITTGSVSGIVISAGVNNYLFRNKIHTISSNSSNISAGSVNGIWVSGATANLINTIHNNIIGDLEAPNANVVNPIYGINIANTGTTSSTHLYYNTIYINASSNGALFGTCGINHAASMTATTGALDMRNNSITNTSTPNGAGLTVAFRRSLGTAGTLANYESGSNNNLFYAGIPDANHLIYSDGTDTAQLISTYKTHVFTAGTMGVRDQASIWEKLRFLSTVGTDANFLKMGNAAASYMESGGAVIAGFDVDFEGDIRSGSVGYPVQANGYGTAPDIGADEFDGYIPHLMVYYSNPNSDGYYAFLRDAFTAINGQDQTGNSIKISLISSIAETATATLNAGNWTALTVFPSQTGLSLTGSLDGTSLINLDGADHVIIDGSINHGGASTSLLLANTSTSALSGTSTLRFMNSAENNTLKYCNLTGSSTSATDGIIHFSTSTAGNGNDNNLIDRCNLTNAGGNRPINALYSLGSSGFENSQNTVSNCNIYNFLNASASSNGINIGSYSTDWTFDANSFYESTSLVPTAGTFNYSALRINNTSGNNFIITGNYFGGQSALCGGTAWSTNAATNHSLRILNLNVGTLTPSSVQNNAFLNWNYRSASATPWTAIEVNGGAVNIGTVTANTIGSDVVADDITLTATTPAELFGIKNNSAGAVSISKNKIGNLHFLGNNGSLIGIDFAGGSGTNSVNDNFIRLLSIDPAYTTSSIYGIRITAGTSTYSNNLITLGGNTATTLYGIYESGASANNKLYFNTIYIGGTLGSGVTNKSYALYSNTASSIRDIRNNIFTNARSTTSGVGLHYGAYLNYGVSTNLNLNFNNYYAPGVGGVLGYYNGTNKTTLPIATGKDAMSLIVNPGFVNAGTANALDYKVNTPLVGVSGTGVAYDYASTARDLPVNMGAFEYYTTKWKGLSTDFSDVANWTSGVVPTGAELTGVSSETTYQPAILTNNVNLSGSGRFDLTAGATLTLEDGPILTFALGFKVATATGAKIVLKSGSKYLNLSSSIPMLEVQRQLADAIGWRMVSSPVSTTFADMFKYPLVTQGFGSSTYPDKEPNLLWWDEADPGTSLQSWRMPVTITDNQVAGRGYFHYVFNGAFILGPDGVTPTVNQYSDALPTTMSVTGFENHDESGTFSFPLTNTPKALTQSSETNTTYYDLNALDEGWNLIGNPTASTLDWNAPSGWTKSNLDESIYVWNPISDGMGEYLYSNGIDGNPLIGKIAPFQAFWVHVSTAAAATLSFTNDVKTSDASVFHRSAEANEHVSIPITLSLGDYKTTSFISFSNNGVKGPDRMDAYQLEPMSENWLSLYTLSSQEHVSPLAINNLPFPNDEVTTIPLYLDAQITGSSARRNFTLNWTLPDNWPSNWKISLLDHQSETSISMVEHSSYSYSTAAKKVVSASFGVTAPPTKPRMDLTKPTMLRSSSSTAPLTIVVSKGKDIEYMAPKPQLLGNYPNPFNRATTVRFSLPEMAKVHVDIYTAQGKKMATLANGDYPAGITEVTWDAKNNAPGMYFIRFVCNDIVETKKALLNK